VIKKQLEQCVLMLKHSSNIEVSIACLLILIGLINTKIHQFAIIAIIVCEKYVFVQICTVSLLYKFVHYVIFTKYYNYVNTIITILLKKERKLTTEIT
jgi:hypothetical protein